VEVFGLLQEPFADALRVSQDVFYEDVEWVARISHGLLVPDTVAFSTIYPREFIGKGRSDVLDGINHEVGVIDFLLEMVEIAIIRNDNIVWNTESVATRVPVGEHLLKVFVFVDIDEPNIITKGFSSTDDLVEHDGVSLENVRVIWLRVVGHHQNPRLGISVFRVHYVLSVFLLIEQSRPLGFVRMVRPHVVILPLLCSSFRAFYHVPSTLHSFSFVM